MSVNTAEELHGKAMALADEALAAELAGDDAKAQKLRASAFEHEMWAADAVASEVTLEPTRSVLHRSAATLAIDCGNNAAAEKLIYPALAGNLCPTKSQELPQPSC